MISWLLYWFMRVTAWPLYWIYIKRRTYYEDKKDTNTHVKGPAIVVLNHRSLKDLMLVTFMFPFRKVYCQMSEAVYTRNKFQGWIMKVVGGVRVDRNNNELSFMDKSEELLEKGKILVVFPEAKISTDGQIKKFAPSYVVLAQKTGVPIIPVYHDGNYGLFKRVHTTIGKKIFIYDHCEDVYPTKQQIDSLNKMVRRKVMSMGMQQQHLLNTDRYSKIFSLRYFLKDIGRLTVYQFNLYFRYKVFNLGEKKNKLKPKGGLLIVANHTRFVDPLAIIMAFWRRRVYCLTGEVVFAEGHPVRNWLLKELGCVRINRYENDPDAINECINILDGGGVLLVFPNGRIHRDGSLDDYKSGAALLASRTGVPMLPIYIKNQPKKWNKVKMYLGESKTVKELCNKEYPSVEDLNAVMDNMFAQISELKREAEEEK